MTFGPDIKPTQYRRFFTRTIVMLMVGISLTPMFLTGMITLYEYQQAYRSKVHDHLGELTLKHSQSIDRFLNDRLGDIRVLTRSYTLHELAGEDLLRERLTIMREEYGAFFVDLGLIDPEGIQQSYAGPFTLEQANYASTKWFQEAQKREQYISDVFTGLRGTPHFIVTTKKVYEGQIWIIRATVNFEAFQALVQNIKIGETGFAFILNRTGEFQTKPGTAVILNRGPYLDLLEGRIDVNRLTILERPDALGVDSIFAFAPLKGNQWILCIQQRAADAYSSLFRAERLAVAIILVGAAVIILVSVLISRRMGSRLAMADKQKAIMNEKVIETGRLASIGEMAAGVAHEINNPVAIMVEEAGWIEDILDGAELKPEDIEEIRRAARQIRTQGGRCKEITFKLLSFARKTDPKVQEVDLNTVVGDVMGLLGQKSRYANIKLEAEMARNLPLVMVSPSEMQQVVLNLVNNAVDAIDQGGGTVTIRSRLEGDYVVMEVEDTGSGIPESNLSRIFDPFFTTKPVGQGTGLGLSICYGIVSKLGGDITVNSVMEQGTTFVVSLPASKGETEDVKKATAREAAGSMAYAARPGEDKA